MEHTPQRAGIAHPHDSQEQRVHEGHEVAFVHAGEYVTGHVEKLETDEHGVHHAHVATVVRVPARSLTLTGRKKDDPKKTEPVGRAHSGPPPSHTHAHADHKPAERKK